MLKVFDTILASSDLSLDRVLGAGLPAALVFYDKDLPANLRQTMDDLARQYAGKTLIVMLAQSDAPKAISRFGVRSFPILVTVRDGKPVTRQEGVRPEDLKPHIAYLVGDGPTPISRVADRSGQGAGQSSTKGSISVNEVQFEKEVLKADRPVLVEFWAPWCGPCHMIAPALEALARNHAVGLKVVKINVDENPGTSGQYGVMSIPTMIVFIKGQEVDRWIGALPDKALRSRVARWI